MHDDLLALIICIQARCPVFLWGPPGIGKSASLEAIAAALDEKLWTIILSIREPSDQGGLPIITPDGVKLHPPAWAVQLVENKGGIVLWDEFNAAPPTTQSSALRVIHGGWAGDLQLPLANTSFVAAGNPTEVSTGAFDLTSAIANRWTHLNMPVRSEYWCDGMTRGWPAPPVRRLPAAWRDDFVPAMRALIVGFIRVRSELLCVLPDSVVLQGRAWPSPRSWDRAATLLGAAQSLGYGPKSAVSALLVLGCVGEAAQIQFSSYITKLDLRDPEEYLANPNLPLPQRQDQLLVTLDGVVAAALQQGGRSRQEFLGRYNKAWAVIGRASDKPDLSRGAATSLARSLPPEFDKDELLPQEAGLFLSMLEKAKIDLGMQRP